MVEPFRYAALRQLSAMASAVKSSRKYDVKPTYGLEVPIYSAVYEKTSKSFTLGKGLYFAQTDIPCIEKARRRVNLE